MQHHDFINFDVPTYIIGNRYVQAGLTRESLIWAFTATSPDYWPLGRFKSGKSDDDNRLQSQKSINQSHTPSLEGAGNLILEKIPLLGLSLFSIYITVFLKKGVDIIISTESIPMDLRIGSALISYVGYIKKMIWPCDLAVFYPFPKITETI